MKNINIIHTDCMTYDFNKKFPLIIADPPYGNIVKDKWDKKDTWHQGLIDFTNRMSLWQDDGDVMYVWGGVGRVGDRPFFKYLSTLEEETDYQLKNLITWSKRRAYGVKDNYLFTREECAYLIKGTSKPNIFNIPLLDQERGYAGYNKNYPAKSKFLRRTNVWTDITELFKGKLHVAEKPSKLAEVMINTHTRAGMEVLDPFAGSGSTGIASINTNRICTLVDNDINSINIMTDRFTTQ